MEVIISVEVEIFFFYVVWKELHANGSKNNKKRNIQLQIIKGCGFKAANQYFADRIFVH